MAASDATAKDKEDAKRRMDDGTKPVEVDKRPYRPKLDSKYVEPEYFPEEDDGIDVLFKTCGRAALFEAKPLPPRDDLILYGPEHEKEYNESIQWADCPADAKTQIDGLIKEFWDVFASDGMKKSIRGFQFFVDTGAAKPICCQIPRYGPHEARVMTKLVEGLRENGLIEEDDGPWGAQIVLAAKPHQGHRHWSDYIWRLCVSYRKLNTITRPYAFPARRCDDAVIDVGRSRFFITIDLAWGYWQVYMHEASRGKTAFFTPLGKMRWLRMPMGAANSHPVFCAMMAKLQAEWDARYYQVVLNLFGQYRDEHHAGSEVIVDDVMLHAITTTLLLLYFREVLSVLKKYRVTANLKKSRFLPIKAEFVGVDVSEEGNAPAESKFPALKAMIERRPQTATDLLGIIGFFGFYQEWIVWYEARIHRWRDYKKGAPPINSDKATQVEYLEKVWTDADQELLREFGAEIMSKPIRKRPDFNRRMYLKTDWSKNFMGAVLTQPEATSDVARKAEEEEIRGGPCVFDRTLDPKELRLRPISMISRRCIKAEHSYHSFTGECAAGVWAIEKFKRYLYGKEFTWLTDCAGVRAIFESDHLANHKIQRWKYRLMRYEFTIVHRPARMMADADTISRYDRIADELRVSDAPIEGSNSDTTDELTEECELKEQEDLKGPTSAIPRSMLALPQLPILNRLANETGPQRRPISMLAKACSGSRTIWDIGAAFNATSSAVTLIGCEPLITLEIEVRPEWNEPAWIDKEIRVSPYVPLPNWKNGTDACPSVDWVVISITPAWNDYEVKTVAALVNEARQKGAEAILLFHIRGAHQAAELRKAIEAAAPKKWEWVSFRLDALKYGATCEADVKVHIFTVCPKRVAEMHLEPDEGEPINTFLEPAVTTRSVLIDGDKSSSHTPERVSIGATFPSESVVTDVAAVEVVRMDGTQAEYRVFPVAYVEDDIAGRTHLGTSRPVFNPDGHAPYLGRVTETQWMDFPFAVLSGLDFSTVRGITNDEVLQMLGVDLPKRKIIAQGPTQTLVDVYPDIIPTQALSAVFEALKEVEDLEPRAQPDLERASFEGVTEEDWDALAMLAPIELNTFTSTPLPDHEAWQAATELDADLKRIGKLLKEQVKIPHDGWNEKAFAAELRSGRLEEEDGVIYRYEARARYSLRQLRARVVPPLLRKVVIAACHASPFSGHSGEHKTLWKILTKYWWPSVVKDVKLAVRGCGHCNVANITSHEAQQKLKTVVSDCPFDVWAFDVWKPGDIPSRGKNKLPPAKAVLTGVEVMAGFAGAAELFSLDSHEVARALVTRFFTVYGMPKLIIIDAGSEFAGMMIDVCAVLMVEFHAVSRGNHKAVLSERFHRYLNKVQKIHAADCETIDDWLLGIGFALYGWNASPVDGTDIPRCFAALGREFPFPLETRLNRPVSRVNNSNQGELVSEHVDAVFPLLAKQRELLKILVQERREHHRNLRNEGRSSPLNPTSFDVGDLVLVRKQVTTTTKKGPAKLQLQARGPYRVLEVLSENTYTVQRIPFDRIAGGNPHKPYKESAARMQRLPSTLVIHKHTDGADANWAAYRNAFSPAPLQHSLGAVEFGEYKKAEGEKWAFEKIEQLWQEDLGIPETDPSEAITPEDPTTTPTVQAEPPTPKAVSFDDVPEKGNESDDSAVRRSLRKRKSSLKQREAMEGGTLKASRPTPLVYKVPLPAPVRSPTASPAKEQSTSGFLSRLRKSRDRLVFIWHKQAGTAVRKWYLVQAFWEPNSRALIEAKRTNTLRVRFWIRHSTDSETRPTHECRFWPEVHEVHQGSDTFKAIYRVRPAHTDGAIRKGNGKYQRYEEEISIPSQIIHGPFNFAPPPRTGGISYRVSAHDWSRLRLLGPSNDVDITDVDEVVPLS